MERLPERPTGWFAVCGSSELRSGEVASRTLFGERIALYRTSTGEARAVHAVCPHLGANLGDGFVRGDELVCPFHQFGFDGEGRCVSTPYDGPPPKKLSARTLPVCETHGVVLLWWDELGRTPWFEVPEYPTEGWSMPRLSVVRFRGHPQDTAENSVDVGHFTTVHGFDTVDFEGLDVDGAHLHARYRFVHTLGPLGWDVNFVAHVHGLGFSLVEVRIPRFGLDIRLFVLPVPVEDGEIELRLGAASRGAGALGRVPRRIVSTAAHWLLRHDAGQDIPIWRERAYVDRPGLARGDGPIGRYRRWARQFYPESSQTIEEVA
ncbi:MAG: (2Fe-2S)-binding protein [Deltaproteobacteria bacterium]|nr:MAG: (2Fe-2S)-binding protein [Deltaproteobacteria bacterium]